MVSALVKFRLMANSLPIPATVYGLFSSRDSKLRYVGQTTETPEQRLRSELLAARKGRSGALRKWIRAELSAGYLIQLQVIVEHGDLNVTVFKIVDLLRAEGCDLLNTITRKVAQPSKPAKEFGPEQRRKMSEAAAKRRHSDRVKAKIGTSRRAYRRRVIGAEGLQVAIS